MSFYQIISVLKSQNNKNDQMLHQKSYYVNVSVQISHPGKARTVNLAGEVLFA